MSLTRLYLRRSSLCRPVLGWLLMGSPASGRLGVVAKAAAVLTQVWMPHSVFALPAHRPLRGSAPSATLEVQVRQPIDG